MTKKTQQSKLKVFSTFIMLTVFTNLFGQNLQKDSLKIREVPHKHYLSYDIFVLPALFYNSTAIGLNYQNATKMEYCLKFGASIFFIDNIVRNYNVNFNTNIYCKNRKNYFPMWVGLSNSLRGVNFEEGYHPNTLRPSIGTGFGRKAKYFGRYVIRLELIAGASLNFTNGTNNIGPFRHISEYSFDKVQPEYYPKIIPTIKFNVAFVNKIR